MRWLKHNSILILILVLGTVLRFHQYGAFPFSGETADEYAWSFLGASLIQENYPASWSYFSSYADYRLPIANPIGSAPLVQPVLDHPPLFSLLPGLAQAIQSDWWQLPSTKVIRLPLILLGIINLGLLWLVAKRILSKPWALLATLIFASAPSFVFASRMALAENLLQTWVLLFILVAIHPKTKNKPVILWIILSVLAGLTKTAGLILPASLILVGLWQKKKELLMPGVLGAVASLGAFVVYGSLLNWQLFWSVLSEQSGRMIGLSTLHNRLFLHPGLVERVFFDGWILLGLGSLAFVWLKAKELKTHWSWVLAIGLSNAFFILLTVGEDTFHAWYDYPVYPLLCLGIAFLLSQIWSKKAWLGFWLVWLALLPVLRIVLDSYQMYDLIGIWPMRFLLLAGGLPLVLAHFNLHQLSKFAFWGLLLIILAANILTIWQMDLTLYSQIDSYYFHCEGRCL